MLIAHIGSADKVGPPRVLASGDMVELGADLCIVISSMKKQMGTADPAAAKAFKRFIQELAADDSSPMWTMDVRGFGSARVIHKDKEEE